MQTSLQTFTFGNQSINIFVPDIVAIQKEYHHQYVPYWAQVWHAAVGLCVFLQQHPEYVRHRTVLELGAGLGLPGIVVASIAKHVCISDKSEEAIAIAEQSVAHHQLSNVICKVFDWNDIKDIPIPEVVLLSDINYEPDAFAAVLKMINLFLANNYSKYTATVDGESFYRRSACQLYNTSNHTCAAARKTRRYKCVCIS